MTTLAPSLAAPAAQSSSRAWLVVAAAIFGVAVHGIAVRALDDWHVFYLAGQRALAGEALYQAHEIPMVFKYAPVTAYVFAPFTVLPERAAGALWLLVTAAAFLRSLVLSARLFAPGAPAWTHLVVFALAVGFYKHMILYGQCDAVLLWLALESEALARRRPLLSGAALAVACLFKPPLGLLAIGALVAREWRRAAAIAVGGALGLVAPALTFGFRGAVEQTQAWRAMLEQTTGPMICTTNNQGVFGFACPLVTPEAGAAFTLAGAAFAAAVVAALGLLAWRVGRADPSRLRPVCVAGAVYLTAVLSPLSWRANLVALVPILYLLLDGLRQLRSRRAWVLGLAAPVLSTVLGLLAYELLSAEGFRAMLTIRTIGVLGVTTAVGALLVQWRAARARAATPA